MKQLTSSKLMGHVAALVRSHMNGSILFKGTISQTKETLPLTLKHISIFGVVFFVSSSLLGIERQKELKKFTILTRKPRSHVRILIYRTWRIKRCFSL